jgi:hypothetical protein
MNPQHTELLHTLQTRFEKNMNRHKGLEWSKIQTKLIASPQKLTSLHQMEKTGGEPDVIGYDKKTDEYIFCDCSEESPKDRRSLCGGSCFFQSGFVGCGGVRCVGGSWGYYTTKLGVYYGDLERVLA